MLLKVWLNFRWRWVKGNLGDGPNYKKIMTVYGSHSLVIVKLPIQKMLTFLVSLWSCCMTWQNICLSSNKSFSKFYSMSLLHNHSELYVIILQQNTQNIGIAKVLLNLTFRCFVQHHQRMINCANMMGVGQEVNEVRQTAGRKRSRSKIK